MTYSYDALKSNYIAWMHDYVPTHDAEAEMVAMRLLKDRDRFLTVEKQTGVPALWIMPVFEREDPNFNTYLGNGDLLSAPTTHVPKGRGPFGTWEAGVCDALELDEIDKVVNWTWELACYEWEKWNGFGPRRHGRPTGYVTAGTNIYQGGKYIADGVWSRGTWDHQLGTLIIAKAIAAQDPEIAKGFADQ